jgi:hypothetical protein
VPGEGEDRGGKPAAEDRAGEIAAGIAAGRETARGSGAAGLSGGPGSALGSAAAGAAGACLPALGAFAVALGCALALASVTHPDAIFPKYLAAAAASPAEQAERLLDYSPLYLALVKALQPGGHAAILAIQAALHAVTAAAVAMAVALLAGRRWAWLGGLGVAAYRPFLVYCGMLEPETVILACLACAMLLGALARRRLEVLAAPALAAAEAAVTSPAPASVAAPVAAPAAAPGMAPPPVVAPAAVTALPRASIPLATAVFVVLAFAALAAAALGRPQHLLLIPVWAWWLAAAAPAGGPRRAARRLVWAAALAVAAAVLGPPLAMRARVTGVPAIMNPGAVFYEGNGPGATGLTRFAPPAVIQLERAHRESVDYGHVAYRRIASAVAGRQLDPLAANRYWTGLAWEAIAARPLAAARRCGRKALLALAPYEGHDLLIAERLDRRLRRRLPWGFAVPLLALPWLPLSRRGRLAELAGPLAVAALAFAVQAAIYASARQRLPAALALWVVLPALAADLVGGRTSTAVRPLLALLLAPCMALVLAAATARAAVLDQLGWDRLLGRQPARPGEVLCAAQDGRLLRPRLRQDAERFAAGVALAGQRRPDDSLRVLGPLLGGRADYTSDDREVGVPQYWAALDLLALRDREQATGMARIAWQVRPDDARAAALALRLAGSPDATPWPLAAWRPPGCDPVSARLDLAAAAAAAGDRTAALAFLRPLAVDFAELVPGVGRGGGEGARTGPGGDSERRSDGVQRRQAMTESHGVDGSIPILGTSNSFIFIKLRAMASDSRSAQVPAWQHLGSSRESTPACAVGDLRSAAAAVR